MAEAVRPHQFKADHSLVNVFVDLKLLLGSDPAWTARDDKEGSKVCGQQTW